MDGVKKPAMQRRSSGEEEMGGGVEDEGLQGKPG